MLQMPSKQPISAGIVIVAAGRGERAGSSKEGPKQYRMIGGKPVIVHTLENFMTWEAATEIVVVIHPDDEALFARAFRHIISATPIETVHGGATRQQSVLAGLRYLKDKQISHVLIHDAVRPFFDHVLLDRIAESLEAGAQAVLPAIPVTDTLKRADNT
ncbi:2-C-methyl-D-erythritol 4-phosphate cytidylyltransferase, partial [Rhizobium johnstonii]